MIGRRNSSEQLPQPPQDILTEARTYDSFDSWLSQIPDERLQQIIGVIDQFDAEDVKDEDDLAHLVGVAMLFSDEKAMLVTEVTQAFYMLKSHITKEAHVRNGLLEKEGEYSMSTNHSNMRFIMTEKGKERFGHGGQQ